MRRAILAAVLPAALGVSFPPAPAAAQVTVGTDVVYATQDVWRGLPRTEAAVLRPSAYAGVTVGPGMLTGGGAWLFERQPRPFDATLTGPAGGRLAETHGWVQYEAGTRAGDVALGAVAYRYRGAARPDALAAPGSTTEVYAEYRPRLGGRLLHPAVRAFHDIDAVRGTYLELELGASLPLLPIPTETPGPFTLLVRGVTGISAGQAAPGAASCADGVCRFPSGGHFGENGITHHGLSAAITPTVSARAPAYLYVAGHVQWNRDPRNRTRAAAAGRAAGDEIVARAWMEAGVSAAVSSRRPR